MSVDQVKTRTVSEPTKEKKPQRGVQAFREVGCRCWRELMECRWAKVKLPALHVEATWLLGEQTQVLVSINDENRTHGRMKRRQLMSEQPCSVAPRVLSYLKVALCMCVCTYVCMYLHMVKRNLREAK